MKKVLFVLLLPGIAAAQGMGSRPDPSDPNAAAAPLSHRSALSAYRAASAPATKGWREANDNVERIGGWRAYAREANAPASAASAAPTPAAPPERATRPATPPAQHRH